MVLGLWHFKAQEKKGERQLALKTLTNPWAKNVKCKTVSKGGSLIRHHSLEIETLKSYTPRIAETRKKSVLGQT